jgi:hypothetical protein
MMPSQPKPERTDPLGKLDFGGLDDFKPTPRAAQQPKPPAETIRAVSEAEGFPSRESAPREKAKPASVKVEQRRYRTGRNKQLSLKVTEETAQRFTRLADEQRLVLGELLERALDAYETAHKRE